MGLVFWIMFVLFILFASANIFTYILMSRFERLKRTKYGKFGFKIHDTYLKDLFQNFLFMNQINLMMIVCIYLLNEKRFFSNVIISGT